MSKSKKKRVTFADVTRDLPPLKELTLQTKLPYVFDLQWDVKQAEDLFSLGVANRPVVRRTLAEHGYDVAQLDTLQHTYDSIHNKYKIDGRQRT